MRSLKEVGRVDGRMGKGAVGGGREGRGGVGREGDGAVDVRAIGRMGCIKPDEQNSIGNRRSARARVRRWTRARTSMR